MMFDPIQFEDKIIAYEKKIHSFHVVYGTRYMKRSDLSILFPQYKFCFIKQEHGKKIVKARSHFLQSADAHWTDQENKALVIQTADCLPVMLMRDSIVCAIHAGWRGVYKKIIIESLQKQPLLKNLDLLVSIGPHISEKNFEVKEDVAQKLLSLSVSSAFKQSGKDEKYKISLMDIVQNQIQSILSQFHTVHFNEDTYSSKLFHSFRRDHKEKTGQYSFVVRTS